MTSLTENNTLTAQDQALIKDGIDWLRNCLTGQGGPKKKSTKITRDKSASKTIIERSFRNIEKLSILCVIKVEVFQEPTRKKIEKKGKKEFSDDAPPKWDRVYSRAWKMKAIAELLKDRFPTIKAIAIVDIQTEDHVDRIIVFEPESQQGVTENKHRDMAQEYNCVETIAPLPGDRTKVLEKDKEKASDSAESSKAGSKNGTNKNKLKIKCLLRDIETFKPDDSYDVLLCRQALAAFIKGRAITTADDVPSHDDKAKSPIFVLPRKFYSDVAEEHNVKLTFNSHLPGCDSDDKGLEYVQMFRSTTKREHLSSKPTLLLVFHMSTGLGRWMERHRK